MFNMHAKNSITVHIFYCDVFLGLVCTIHFVGQLTVNFSVDQSKICFLREIFCCFSIVID